MRSPQHLTARLGAFTILSVLAATVVTSGTGEPAAQASSNDPSGETVPTQDLDGWRHIFADDFPTDVAVGDFPQAVGDKWKAYKYGWKDSSRRGTYAPNKVVSIEDGVLTKNIRTEDGKHLVAAILPKVPGTDRWGQMYGRYSVRMRADSFQGYKIAWLLWPDEGTHITGSPSGVGGNGEIDWPEARLNAARTYGYVHHQDGTRGGDQVRIKAPAFDRSEWHTYTIEWSPDLVVFHLDGEEIGRTTKRIPNTPMHWVLQTETKIGGRTSTQSQGQVQIDWVSAWQWDPKTDAPPPPGESPPPPAPTTTTTTTTTTMPPPPPPRAAPKPKPAPGNPIANDIWVSWPADGARVDADSPFKFDSRRSDVTAVKWYVDGRELAYDDRGPVFMKVWETSTISDGRHKVFAKARLSNGTWITSRTRSFTVVN